MFAIVGALQPYPWGTPGGLNPWLGDRRDEGPQAELWFGAHPRGASPLVNNTGTLADVTTPGDVPLLVKLLAAAHPLSIQLHPPADQAARLFAQGSSLVADPLAKDELLLALEPFSVFAGWRSGEQAAARLRAVDPSLEPAAHAAQSDDHVGAVRYLLGLSGPQVADYVERVPGVIVAVAGSDEEVRAYALAARTFPDDPGVLVALLLDHRLLSAHEAVYMPAGGVHAYVQGLGVEVMTASDNVLRLGMTSKEIAVEEALGAVVADSDPHFLGPDTRMHDGAAVESDYRPTNAPFTIAVVRDTASKLAGGRYRCVLCLGGHTEVVGETDSLSLLPGQAAAVLASDGDVEVVVSGTAVQVVSAEAAE